MGVTIGNTLSPQILEKKNIQRENRKIEGRR
jgi:hypothetical protein